MFKRPQHVTQLAWFTLAVNLLVIAWGAWVRASGSGAGCGNHWPMCNGVIVPQSPTLHTIIEFTHRVTSGLAFLLTLLLVVATRRAFPPGHRARAAAIAALGFMLLEISIGAGLVLFNLVAVNASITRGVVLGVHLVNTQFLLTAILLTAWWSTPRPRMPAPWTPRDRGLFLASFAALIVVGMAGVMASLGDTLFPARTLAEGMAQDRNPALNVLLHIRIWHPVLAIVAGIWLIAVAARVIHRTDGPVVHRAAMRVIVAVGLQWCVGVTSLLLLVPVALQLVHLMLADGVWLALVWLAAAGSEEP